VGVSESFFVDRRIVNLLLRDEWVSRHHAITEVTIRDVAATVQMRLDAGEQIVAASIPKQAAEELGLTLPGDGNDQAETLLLPDVDVGDRVGNLLVTTMPVVQLATATGLLSRFHHRAGPVIQAGTLPCCSWTIA
jgi:hypothetical protein